ncbi:MAG: carbamoyltransferase HypF [Bauldia sp.]|uniref:carbamoyltransferase HypF n=1 Tax=Bauldia sp. TaxID=2575872 RepID=UPI001DA5CA8B|nr:carbamoyltransferase HypF [Bauldia sp.]MCB1496278.1 carbamoyltransferase HypF [Bauldia sp.]
MRAEQAITGDDAGPRARKRIVVRGVVQGVGFRPFVYRQATTLGLAGWVGNTPDGVTIEVEGADSRIDALVTALDTAAPVGARVDDIEITGQSSNHDSGFSIRESDEAGLPTAEIPADIATCPDCLEELFDPLNRRYHYPFINCTQCGPRFSIICDMPYDRARTTMAGFAMCPECQAEYEDPGNRRFHAEPNACPACGPRIALWDGHGHPLGTGEDALGRAAGAIRDGRLVAVKGVGGFHLFCDARNDEAVRQLRDRKRREEKPFAVMFPSLEDAKASCRIGREEEALLTGRERPIVLCRRTGGPVSESVAPGTPRLGIFLPYAPLHHLLMRDLGFPVVATSGNISDEPIATDEYDVIGQLTRIADLFLVHDRPIIRPVEDSVAQVVDGSPQLLRVGRGYAPTRIAVDGAAGGIVAVGGHLKTTVAITQPGSVVVGAHVGDLETVEARLAHGKALEDMIRFHAIRPRLAANDYHPDFASRGAAEGLGVPIIPVQHHLAHVAACLAENEIAPPVLGVAWDGTGYGGDGTIWGGEFLHVEKTGWRRVACLRQFPLPGGEAAVREPRRSALGLLVAAFGSEAFGMNDLPPVAAFDTAERRIVSQMLARDVNAPLTSSVGRLLDAFAALCGLRQVSAYEGQAPIEFDSAAGDLATGRCYDFPISADKDGLLIVDWQPALESLLADLRAGASSGSISEAVHNGLVEVVAAVAGRIGEPRVVLTGGCFQNIRLTEGAIAALTAAGMTPYWHHRVPPNDGGIALGQAVWAAWTEGQGD